MKIHPSARTTRMLREEIHHSKENQASLAEKYNVTCLTIRKWQKREIFADKSHRPDHLKTTLS
ncbi:MAG: IS481 family transposase, partial [Endozoicomonadaceae bacterium]|nr:IS481 family transposase [Endozoicomonadaceae bacterium]